MLSDPVRFSNLKMLAKSPLHYHHAVTVGRDDKPWLKGGRGLHAVLFDTPYVIFKGASRNSKEWNQFCQQRAALDELKRIELRGGDPLGGVLVGPEMLDQLAAHEPEAEVILAKELAEYEAMAESIRKELARQGLSYLLEGDIEQRIEWEWLGRKCAGTPDVVGRSWLVDVKTTCNAAPAKWIWDARKFCYAEQLAWYNLALELTLPAETNHRDLFDIAVEKTAPYPVVIWRVTDKMREQAEKTLRIWFEQLLACEGANVWPGYTQTVQDLDVLESEGLTLQIGGEDVEVE